MMSTQVDPICGMQVQDTDSIQSQYKDTTYYFCSTDCQRKFDDLLKETSEAFKDLRSRSNVTDSHEKTDERLLIEEH